MGYRFPFRLQTACVGYWGSKFGLRMFFLLVLWSSLFDAQMFTQGDPMVVGFKGNIIKSDSLSTVTLHKTSSTVKIFITKGAVISNLPDNIEVVEVKLPIARTKSAPAKRAIAVRQNPKKEKQLPTKAITVRYTSLHNDSLSEIKSDGTNAIASSSPTKLSAVHLNRDKWNAIHFICYGKIPLLNATAISFNELQSFSIRPPPSLQLPFFQS